MDSVRDAPGLICQGCARSVPSAPGGPSPGFSQVFILKIVKVLCFDTLLQVFILNGLQGTTPATRDLILRNVMHGESGIRAESMKGSEGQVPQVGREEAAEAPIS